MRPTIVLVHGAVAESAGSDGVVAPTGIRPPAAAGSPPDPLALDPLSPIDAEPRWVGAGRSDSESTSKR